jgi:hypothetical protein
MLIPLTGRSFCNYLGATRNIPPKWKISGGTAGVRGLLQTKIAIEEWVKRRWDKCKLMK